MDINSINEYMKQFSWLDFELIRIDPQTVELHGFISEAYKDKIIITFSSVQLYHLLMKVMVISFP